MTLTGLTSFPHFNFLLLTINKPHFFQFFDYCPTWTTEVDENPETYAEQNLFLQSVEVEDTIIRVNLKLGFLFGQKSPGNGKP